MNATVNAIIYEPLTNPYFIAHTHKVYLNHNEEVGLLSYINYVHADLATN